MPLALPKAFHKTPVTTLYLGDCLEVVPRLGLNRFDAIVTDPPYGLGFMGKHWDHGVPGIEFWQAMFKILKPSGYLLAMGGTRTYHRLTCNIEDAGWEIRDCLMWLYGSGFPKGKGCLKPAYEPILLARKPGKYVLPLGIDDCLIGQEVRLNLAAGNKSGGNSLQMSKLGMPQNVEGKIVNGRWPANVVLSVPEDEYIMRSDVTTKQKRELFRWLHENPEQ